MAPRIPEQHRLSKWGIAALLIAAMQTPLGSTMIAVALPDIGTAFSASLATATGLLVVTYMLVTIIGQSPGGKLADAFGRWQTLRLGIVVGLVGSAMGALAPALWLVVSARCLTALSGALMAPAVLALFREYVPAERRGMIFGAYSATVGVAAALGPPLGGELVHWFGWRGIFLVNIPLLLAAAVVIETSRKPGGQQPRRTLREVASRFDWIGMALLVAGVAGLGYASVWTVVLGLTLAAAFVAWETQASDPMLRLGLFASRTFSAACLVIFLQSLAMYGLMFQLPQFFEVVRAATPRETGSLLFIMMVGLFVASIAGGALADRFGARAVAVWGVSLMTVGVVWLTRLQSFQTPSDAFIPVFLLGIALGATWAPAQASAMSAVDDASSGMAAATTTTCRYLGGAAGALVLAAGLSHAGFDPLPDQRVVVWIYAAAVMVSAIGCLQLSPKPRSAPAP